MKAGLTEFSTSLGRKLSRFENGPYDFFDCLILTYDTNLGDIDAYALWYC